MNRDDMDFGGLSRDLSRKTHIAEDGTIRQNHYGAGEQPWDVIVRLGWGPAFAAGNALKYLRRTKEPEHSLESARWYWARLHEAALVERTKPLAERPATDAGAALLRELSSDERKLLIT